MDVNRDKKHLAIAGVPCQTWGDLYPDGQAMKAGTVFEDLDMPFFVTEGTVKAGILPGLQPAGGMAAARMRTREEEERDQLLQQICEVSFALHDLTLYLDTHPQEQEALKAYSEKNRERKELKKKFAEKFYPLTRDCMAECSGCEAFCWQEAPCPWEGGCI